ncbi:LacI family DNA-binding transcriptional regulator [Microbacterium hydrocarbonoxydans]|uniref:LacI family DNA-binding transcriptional regulator n=1 Tax=Microbacterium hydrocarbonoxydans TaxID=273678 RepID=UPI0007BC7B37|nr:LacI family DNA-binding transcriptional regulator [Microbacterium hydrocarbonoxydans]GAT72073.1 putative transcriptional regulator, LacI family [Microbacterium sp. HM58-2]
MAEPAQLTGAGEPDRSGSPASRRRATILDVAAAAGVSRQTVTRAINDMPGISAETRRRVLDAASALSYRPSRFGRGLVTGGDPQLGLVVSDLRNPYSPELAAAIVRRAAADGWSVSLVDIGLAGSADRLLHSLHAQVDVVVGYLGEWALGWESRFGATPLILLDADAESEHAGVRLDPAAAIEDLAAHLVTVGTRRPVVLDASEPHATSSRGIAILDALERRGLRPEVVHVAASSPEHAAAVAAQIIRRSARPDALLAFNDLMAFGVLSACRHAGLDVPGDIRVAGVDGLAIGTLVAPTLTTLAVDFDEVARHTLELAAALSDASPGADLQRVVSHRLVLRESA